LYSKIIQSSNFVAQNANFVKIKDEAISAFLASLKKSDYENAICLKGHPLKFNSLEEEVNFSSITNLINFGSGFRKELHAFCGRGAYETIQFGLLGLHISGFKLDTEFLLSANLTTISEYFKLPLQVEKEHQPGIYIYVDSPVKPLAQKITNVFNETGNILETGGYSSLGNFVLSKLKKQSGDKPSASALVTTLIETFPAFKDESKYKNTTVYIYKKVQLLATDLYRSFSKSQPKYFDFYDIDTLTIFPDNVVPAVLRKLGILNVSDELANLIDTQKELLHDSEYEIELRALSLVAADRICTKARESHLYEVLIKNAADLDYYLWVIGKSPEFRSVERHVTKDTIYY